MRAQEAISSGTHRIPLMLLAVGCCVLPSPAKATEWYSCIGKLEGANLKIEWLSGSGPEGTQGALIGPINISWGKQSLHGQLSSIQESDPAQAPAGAVATSARKPIEMPFFWWVGQELRMLLQLSKEGAPVVTLTANQNRGKAQLQGIFGLSRRVSIPIHCGG